MFKDKQGTPFTSTQPLAFLSQKAINRRIKQHISIDETDLPVSPHYIDSLRAAGNVHIINQSKWLNQVCIETSDIEAITKINAFPFVTNLRAVHRTTSQVPVSTRSKLISEFGFLPTRTMRGGKGVFEYGNASGQITIHAGDYLHEKGYRGQGMTIAVIDAGFYRYESLPAFDSINLNHQVLETYDFVKNKTSVNEEHAHGMQVLSVMASNIPGKLIGTSPKANYLLYRSEDAATESIVEEQYWIAAIERADSIGADIATTSLGYNTFDNPATNYTYADMNGKTSMMSRAATMAARKGMIVLASAGNEGAKEWKFITTPADADSILAVGAVDVAGVPGTFTSYGPTADGRIAPTVASVGVSTYISSTSGNIVTGNGTSFAAPNLAGLVACFWQAFPDFTNMEIIEAITKSSTQYKNPNNRVGYGIPNFRLAYEDLEDQRNKRRITAILGERVVKAFPNPFKDQFTIAIKPPRTALASVIFYNGDGRLIASQQISLVENEVREIIFTNLSGFPKSLYILKFTDGKTSETLQIMKQ